MRVRPTWLFVGVVLSIPIGLLAQAPPLTAEFQVNTHTTDLQARPSVAVGPTGNFVVAWGSYGQDGSKYGIFGQRYDGLGNTIGSEFQVNTYTTGNQRYASVGIDDTGNFVVVWASNGDGSEYGVFGQRYDSSGSKAGPEFRANTYTTNAQDHPRVAVNGDGSFVVVWQDNNRDLSGYAITGQRFNASGAKVGSDFQVNTQTGNQQIYPAIAADREGNFIVVWQSFAQDGDGQGIFGQRFDRSGAKIGSEFQVNTYTPGHQEYPAVAVDPKGNFVVAWQAETYHAHGQHGIYSQRFNSGAEKVGPEVPVVEAFTTTQKLAHPSVAVDGRGNFVVVWDTFTYSVFGPTGVFGQRYDHSGAPDGASFQINTFTSGNESYPAVGVNPAGDLVIAWSSDPQDGSSFGIFARRSNVSPVSMQVDAHAAAGSSSDVNGVLEQGETIAVEPSWKIMMGGGGPIPIPIALSGTASDFFVPGGGSYNLDDTSADYGLTSPGGTGNCYDGTIGHDCYLMTVGSANHAGVTHWDTRFSETVSSGGLKYWKLHIGDSFSDVPRAQPFYKKIETMLHNGITSGCTATAYCPDVAVGRDQMAIFIAKGITGAGELVPSTGKVSGSSYNCVPFGTSLFTDVLPTDSFCKHVHYLAAQNVTLGCNPGQYCPSQTITRDAMASFITKAIVAPGGGNAVPLTYGPDPGTGRSYSCAPGTPNLHFIDVSTSNAFCKHIHYLWAKGIVDGCSATQYCPGASVKRDAMAKFIANGFGLQLYGP
jgi:hypothetical protein